MNLLEILKKNADNAKSYIDGLVSKKQDTLTFDTAPTKGSQNPVTSDGIQKAIAAKTVDLSNYPTKDGIGATGNWSINAATAITATKASQDSNGRVIADTYLKKAGDTAAGDIAAPNFIGHLKGNADTATKATQDASGNIIADTYATKAALSTKQEKLTFDTTPTKGSTNPVTSNGVKAYIDQAIASIVDADNKSY